MLCLAMNSYEISKTELLGVHALESSVNFDMYAFAIPRPLCFHYFVDLHFVMIVDFQAVVVAVAVVAVVEVVVVVVKAVAVAVAVAALLVLTIAVAIVSVAIATAALVAVASAVVAKQQQ